MFRLRIERGGQKDKLFTLREGSTVVGRSKTKADVVLERPDVSRQHIRIDIAGEDIQVENLSQYGFVVDGMAVSQTSKLRPGQRLCLGDHTVLVLEQADEPDTPEDDFDLLSRAETGLGRDVLARDRAGSGDTNTNAGGEDDHPQDEMQSFAPPGKTP